MAKQPTNKARFNISPAMRARLDAGYEAVMNGKLEEGKQILLKAHADLVKEKKASVEITWCHHQLGLVCFRLSQFDEAEKWLRQGLSEPLVRFCPPQYQARMLSNLAGILVNVRHQLAEAEELYKREVALNAKYQGEDHSDTVGSRSELGALYQAQGRHADAESLLTKALMSWEKMPHPDASGIAHTLSALARVHQTHHRYALARELLERAEGHLTRQFGADDYRLIEVTSALGSLFLRQFPERTSEGLSRFEKALKLSRTVYGETHPTVIACLDGQAACLQALGRLEEAEPLLIRCLELIEHTFGRHHGAWAHSAWNLGNFYMRHGQHRKAERLCRQAMSTVKSFFGEAHPQVYLLMNNLAELCVSQGNFQEAEELYQQVLVHRQEQYGPNHPQLLATLSRYIPVLREVGRTSEADELDVRLAEAHRAIENENSGKHKGSRQVPQPSTESQQG